MQDYKIAGLLIRIDFGDRPLFGAYGRQLCKFETPEAGEPDICITVASKDQVEVPKGRLLMDEHLKWLKKPDGGYCLYCWNQKLRRAAVLAEMDPTWRNIRISVPEMWLGCPDEEYRRIQNANVFHIIGRILNNLVGRYDGFCIHASSIDYNGQGLLFSAPSGTGKSTHVRLWLESHKEQTRIINDDAPIVRLVDGEPVLFGTPWCGSSFLGINDSVRLSAMVAIERGKANVIRCLDPREAVIRLLPRVTVPYFSESMSELTVRTFEKVLQKVPSYQLACTINPEAVELVRSCLKE